MSIHRYSCSWCAIDSSPDSCRMWESHTEATDSWSGGPDPEYPQAIYKVAEDTQSLVALME